MSKGVSTILKLLFLEATPTRTSWNLKSLFTGTKWKRANKAKTRLRPLKYIIFLGAPCASFSFRGSFGKVFFYVCKYNGGDNFYRYLGRIMILLDLFLFKLVVIVTNDVDSNLGEAEHSSRLYYLYCFFINRYEVKLYTIILYFYFGLTVKFTHKLLLEDPKNTLLCYLSRKQNSFSLYNWWDLFGLSSEQNIKLNQNKCGKYSGTGGKAQQKPDATIYDFYSRRRKIYFIVVQTVFAT